MESPAGRAELRYYPWGETRYNTGTTPTRRQYTGQASYTAEFGLYFYNARWYDPALGRFAQADTLVPVQSQGVQAWDRYAYVNNNAVNYADPTGNYGEDVHYDLTFSVLFMAAFDQARAAGFNEQQSIKFAHELASVAARTNQESDAVWNVGNSAVWRPVGENKTSHWYMTPEAEEWVKQTENPSDLGKALHAYEDSYAHWQKLGEPATAAEIWDRHFNNQIDKVKGAESIDNYNPQNDPIDAAMTAGLKTLVAEWVTVYMEKNGMAKANRKATYDSEYIDY